MSCAQVSAQVGIFLNSIEMMEVIRCGRRKQRNPRRKNVENGEEGDEADDSALDKNKNKIVQSPPPSNSYHGDEVTGHLYDNQDEIEAAAQKMTVETVKPEKYITPEEKVAAILREIQSATPNSTLVGDKHSSAQSVTSTEKHRGSKAEEAKIAELLNRGDTAVIYPEPVSDNDEQQNNEGAGSEEEEIVLKCMHCPQTFLRAIVLRDHMREQHADKPLKFMCPKCDETFHQKSQLDKHLTLHSPTSQVCAVCNKTFANVYRLQRHMISHNESTDLRKFKCPECGKAFKFKHHLKEHVRIHSGEKPFVCMNCGKRFSHSGSFSSHTTSKKCWGLSATRGREATQTSNQNSNQGGQSSTSFSGNGKQFSRSPLQSVPVTVQHQQHFIPHPYAQQKGIPPFFYPPQMFATPDGFLHPMYSTMQHPSMPGLALSTLAAASKERSHNSPHPSMSSMSSASRSTRSMSPHSMSTRSFSPHSRSERSISPGSVFSMSSPPPTPSRRSMTPVYQKPEAPTPAREKLSASSLNSEQVSPDMNSNTKLLTKMEETNNDNKTINDIETSGLTNSTVTSEKQLKSEIALVESTTKENESKMERRKESNERFSCQFCSELFESPITQHQHERYLCKLNKDVLQHRAQMESCQSPHSTVSDISHVESTTNGSIENGSDEEEVEEMYKDSDCSLDDKNMRIRTQFTEEQQLYLRAQYMVNPRPRKFELIRMGNKIGFPKRVVQVWFQNMRARERKYGREMSVSSSSSIRFEGREPEQSKTPTYIPNVPKPFPNLLSMSNQATSQPATSHSQQTTMGKHGESPLDLSTRKSPPLAHGGSSSRHSTPESVHDDQVLNLSLKKEPSEEREIENTESREQSVDKDPKEKSVDSEDREKSVDKQTRENSVERCEKEHSEQDDNDDESNDKFDAEKASELMQKSFQDSPIFKYMQQEGMFHNKQLHHLSGTISPSLALTNALSMQTQILQQTMASVLKMPCYQPNTELNIPHATPSSLLFDTARTIAQQSTSQSTSSDTIFTSTPDPAIYSFTSDCHPALSSPMTNMHCPRSSLPEDTHNLATLAEAAQQAAIIMSGKPKRLRKKTWRQMEAEEVQLEFEDSQSTDEDQPSRKKRKSWKGHRVDRDEGMYACDQCNKLFSKQSSLARHKYEHSGARPFACDMCTKSFKHKHHLTEHKRLHSGEKPFQCKKCGKRFSHSGSFSQHMNHRYNYCSPHKTSDGDMDGEELSSQESP